MTGKRRRFIISGIMCAIVLSVLVLGCSSMGDSDEAADGSSSGGVAEPVPPQTGAGG
jgi:hypothetical protein